MLHTMRLLLHWVRCQGIGSHTGHVVKADGGAYCDICKRFYGYIPEEP